jgi:hypothetical protein
MFNATKSSRYPLPFLHPYINLVSYQHHGIPTGHQIHTKFLLTMTHGDELSPFQQWYQKQQAKKRTNGSCSGVASGGFRKEDREGSSGRAESERKKREEAGARHGGRLEEEYEEIYRENEERRRDQLGPGC